MRCLRICFHIDEAISYKVASVNIVINHCLPACTQPPHSDTYLTLYSLLPFLYAWNDYIGSVAVTSGVVNTIHV